MCDFNTKKSITCLLLKNSIYQKQINHVIVWIPKFSAQICCFAMEQSFKYHKKQSI